MMTDKKVKKVSGYLDSRNRFWPTKVGADFASAAYTMKEVLSKEGMSQDFILKFIWENREQIREYLDTREKAWNKVQEDDEVTRDNKL